MEHTRRMRQETESPLLRISRLVFETKTAPKVFLLWSGDREAEGGSLLRSYTPKGYRGFKSPLLRTFFKVFFVMFQ